MKKSIPGLLMLVFLILSLCAPPAAAQQKKVLRDFWYVTYSHGIRTGSMHDLTTLDTEKKQITTESTSVRKIRRGDDVMESVSTSTYVETEDGRPLSFRESERETSSPESLIEGTVEGEKAKIRISTYGKVEEKTIDWDRRIIFAAAQDRFTSAKGFAKGTTYELYGFEIDLMKPSRQVVTVEGDEEVQLLDGKRTLHKLNVAFDLHPGMRFVAWCDDTSKVYRAFISMGESDLYIATKETATSPITASADLMDKTSLPLNVRLPFFHRLNSVLYRLTFKEKYDTAALTDSRQSIVATKGSVVDLLVKSLPLGFSPPTAETLPDRELYMRDTSYLQWKDPAVMKLTEEALKGEKNPVAQARLLRKWVYDNLKKNYATGFATAKEIAEKRVGDCTEHSVLLAAMLRAAGIPSRVAVGLICVDGTFGWHMWTQAFINRWVDLDAAVPSEDFSPDHIRFGESPLKDVGVEEIMAPAHVIGNLKLDVIEYTTGGKRYSAAALPPEDLMQNGWYVSYLYGFRFYKPKSWEFLTRADLERYGMKGVVAITHRASKSAIVVDCQEGSASKEQLTTELASSFQVVSSRDVAVKKFPGYEFIVKDRKSGSETKFLFAVTPRVTYYVIVPTLSSEAERGYQTLLNSFEVTGE